MLPQFFHNKDCILISRCFRTSGRLSCQSLSNIFSFLNFIVVLLLLLSSPSPSPNTPRKKKWNGKSSASLHTLFLAYFVSFFLLIFSFLPSIPFILIFSISTIFSPFIYFPRLVSLRSLSFHSILFSPLLLFHFSFPSVLFFFRSFSLS